MENSPQPNSTISHYRIISSLGAGGMGEVFLAEDTKLDRKVAIRVLPPESVADKHSKKRLLKEAHAIAKVDHDYDSGQMDTRIRDRDASSAKSKTTQRRGIWRRLLGSVTRLLGMRR